MNGLISQFFDSINVKIFPSYNRGVFSITSPGPDLESESTLDVVLDPEARLSTEYNFTHIPGLLLGGDTYVIESTSEKLRCVIHGYYFEITGANLPQDSGYLIVCVKNSDILEDAHNKKTWTTSTLAPMTLNSTGDSSKLCIARNALGLDDKEFITTDIDGEQITTAVYKCKAIYFSSNGLELPESEAEDGYTFYTLDLTDAYLKPVNDDNGHASLQVIEDIKSLATSGVKDLYGAEIPSTNALTLIGLDARLDKIESTDETKEGSIAKALKDAKDYTNEAIGANADVAAGTPATGIRGEIAEAKSEVIGTPTDTKEAATVQGAKAFATDAVDTAKSELIGEDTDTTHAKTIKGAKDYAKAYADSLASNYDDAGAAEEAIATIVGDDDTDTAESDTITGAKKYADNKDEILKRELKGTTDDTKDSATIAGAKKYAKELVDALTGQGEGGEDAPGSLADETAARKDADKAINDKIGGSYSSTATVHDAIEDAKSAGTAALKTIGDANSGLVQKVNQNAADIEALAGTNGRVAAVESTVTTLIGSDANKSVRTIAAEETAKIVADADTNYDTLKEIADFIMSDETGAAKMANDITQNTADIDALEENVAGHETRLDAVETAISDLQTTCLSKTDVEGSKLGIYAVAFDLSTYSGDLEGLSPDFRDATSSPIVFISGCSKLPEPPTGYAWFSGPNEDALKVEAIAENIILYLKAIQEEAPDTTE